MLVAVEMLVKGVKTKAGNHSSRQDSKGRTAFVYYSTTICLVDHVKRQFSLDDGGYSTSSTHRAMNDYKKYFLGRYYTEVTRTEMERGSIT